VDECQPLPLLLHYGGLGMRAPLVGHGRSRPTGAGLRRRVKVKVVGQAAVAMLLPLVVLLPGAYTRSLLSPT
jgi:hypothetical protein